MELCHGQNYIMGTADLLNLFLEGQCTADADVRLQCGVKRVIFLCLKYTLQIDIKKSRICLISKNQNVPYPIVIKWESSRTS